MSCTNATKPFDKTSTSAADLIASKFTSSDGSLAFADNPIFSTFISYGEKSGFKPSEAVMNLSITVKEEAGCKGVLAIRSYTLVPATLAYRVIVLNNTIRLDEGYTFADDVVKGYYFTPGSSSGVGVIYYSGMALALNGMSLLKVTLSFGSVVGIRVTTEGVTTLRYQRQREKGADKLGYPKCDSY